MLVGEVFKLVVSAYLTLTDRSESKEHDGAKVGESQGTGIFKLLWLIRHSSKVIVLVILYALSNLLSYYALARVDAAAYTVLLQVIMNKCE